MDGESRTDTAPRKDADRRRATEESRIRLPRVSLRAGPEMATHEEREEVEGDDQAEDEARERAKPAGDHQRRQPDSERLVSVFQTQPLDDLSTHRCVGTRPLTQYPAEAKPETRMGQDESGPSTLAKCLLCEAGAVFTCDGLRRRTSILDEVKPLTGEPDAGKPPVRFGGRGDRIQSVLPTPITHKVATEGVKEFGINASQRLCRPLCGESLTHRPRPSPKYFSPRLRRRRVRGRE